MLAGYFFSGPTEQLQFEGFASAAETLDERKRNRDIQNYSLDDILNVVQQRMDLHFPDPHLQINDMTGRAILRKVKNRRRGMPWLDAIGRPSGRQASNALQRSQLDLGNAQERTIAAFDLGMYVERRRLLVIDYSQMDEHSYALILSYFLRICHQYRQRHNEIGIVQLVDEAHRIFDNESRHSATLVRSFERVMREGRSVDHSQDFRLRQLQGKMRL